MEHSDASPLPGPPGAALIRAPRVLHCLSQRPLLTGSGTTLDALVTRAAAEGLEQAVSVGIPAEEAVPSVGGLPPHIVFGLRFGTARLPFPVPGMSDTMPYRSTVFSRMDARRLAAYRAAWRRHLAEAVRTFRPDLIHAHHLWIMTSLLPDVAAGVPIIVHCHGTALRQAAACPGIAREIRAGLARCDLYLALHPGQIATHAETFGLSEGRFRVVGAGYREELFHPRGRVEAPGPAVLYVGKIADAKGLPELLDAADRLAREVPGFVLHVAGGGAGRESAALRARMGVSEHVRFHGRLEPEAVAELMRLSAVFVLPSYYEGLPLVLVEALACGCRVVSTALPGVVGALAPRLGPALTLVPPPRMRAIDVPEEADRPAFAAALAEAIRGALDGPAPDPGLAAPFGWGAVWGRVRDAWREVGARSRA